MSDKKKFNEIILVNFKYKEKLYFLCKVIFLEVLVFLLILELN